MSNYYLLLIQKFTSVETTLYTLLPNECNNYTLSYVLLVVAHLVDQTSTIA